MMNYKLLILPLLLLFLQNEEQGQKADEISATKIDSLANRYLELGRFSGTILVAGKDSILYHKSFGLADYKSGKEFTDRTAFKVGAISELFTEAVIRNLAAEGLVDLEEKVSVYIPEISDDYTVNDLLQHNSGLPEISTLKRINPDNEYSTIAFAKLAANAEQNSGKSDLGYNILGVIAEKVLELPFEQIVQKYSEEWELENTFFQNGNSEVAKGYLFHNYRGAGMELQESGSYNIAEAFSSKGLISTASDVVKISRQLPDRSIDIAGYLQDDGFSYSLNKPDEEITIVVLSNRRHPVAREISNAVKNILNIMPYQIPLPRKQVEVDPGTFKNFAGSYSLNAEMSLQVLTENDSLFIMMGPNKMHLKPQSANQFYLEETDAAIRFITNADNKVTGAVLLNGFIEGDEIRKIESD